ncbi:MULTISPECIES: 16S rRNA (cytidine(1402)-2'-O)-methyltransferase [unclassified Oceanobacillus]|uniref:16S rRNA (cytidine(1402)-2'-O)-methyltransferase n=1 Tax=unclassified Oceanobacillus TaxID=2630292 RepID=UPI001BED2D9E|nr:16S rRNA (cytidine(1402)-2'-O)-methyltransferase [Oceanobacillus sp. ISL-74]MBT2652695.1 16S rRNA (cytidine(1402)-2'-O)-methyltransferase [Oceanobacillus sp. ISL-73]
MNIQKSFENEDAALYVVPTPIGNLEDITYRAIRMLKEASVIAAEDTRNTKKLLHYFEIETPLISYHEHNHQSRVNQLMERIKDGEMVALVSDAGMPAISDPGVELVQAAIAEELKVIVLPGANAALSALVGSGLTTQPFTFYGFLPRKKKEKKQILEDLQKTEGTIVFYESPYRVKDTVEVIQETYGNRNMALGRELTKRFEEYVRGTAEEIFSWCMKNEMRGEFVVMVEGRNMSDEADILQESTWWESMTLHEHVTYYISTSGFNSKEAIKQTAVDRGIPKREVYQAYHIQT